MFCHNFFAFSVSRTTFCISSLLSSGFEIIKSMSYPCRISEKCCSIIALANRFVRFLITALFATRLETTKPNRLYSLPFSRNFKMKKGVLTDVAPLPIVVVRRCCFCNIPSLDRKTASVFCFPSL